MKRERTRNFGVRLILMFIILTPALANAQLDTLHFIPPWHHKNTYNESSKILVVTTPSGTPVNVSVELGDGTVVATGTCTNTSDFTYNAGASSGNCGTIGDAALNTVQSKNIQLKPTTFIKYVDGAPIQIDLTALVYFNNKAWVGPMFRTGDSFGALARLNITDQLGIGYAFDWSFANRTGTYNNGSHEVMLRYDFIFKDKGVKVSPRYF